MKEILISIQPKWVEKIINGEMSIIVQKTRPKIETPFKCYIYCTNTPKYHHLYDLTRYNNGETLLSVTEHNKYSLVPKGYLNGKVIGEFVCDNIEKYAYDYCPHTELGYDVWYDCGDNWYDIDDEELQKTGLTNEDFKKYGKGKDIYGWHIDSLKIYDRPKELSEFYKPFKYDGDGIICGTEKEMDNIYEWDCETLFKDRYPDFKFENCKCKNCPKAKDFYRLTRPPKSWCYVEELEDIK